MKKLMITIFALVFLFTLSCKKEKTNNLSDNTLLNLVNSYRVNGCNCGGTDMSPVDMLRWNSLLEKAATDHSKDMNTNNYFSHTGQSGSSAGDRISAAGYNSATWGENIANGYTTEEAVIKGWINSEGHCKNIMNGNFTEMGIGRDGNYWTQVFARPSNKK